jgi:hypothetical protein
MALYIEDPKICELASSEYGLKLISNFISVREGSNPMIENIENSIIFQLYCWVSTDGVNFIKSNSDSKFPSKTNAVMMLSKGQICINPIIDKNRVSYIHEMKEFLESLPTTIRDRKIDKILE